MKYTIDEMISKINELGDHPDNDDAGILLKNLIMSRDVIEGIRISLDNIGAIESYAFYDCTRLALTSLPESVTSIGRNAFCGCRNLALTHLPEVLKSVDEYAFFGCTSLTSLTFKGTSTSIASNTFASCTNLTTINVPWSEGEVANAPWGATNATINYNYTEE